MDRTTGSLHLHLPRPRPRPLPLRPRASVPRRHMHVYALSYMAGHVGLVGLSLFAATEEHTIGVHSVRLFPRMV